MNIFESSTTGTKFCDLATSIRLSISELIDTGLSLKCLGISFIKTFSVSFKLNSEEFFNFQRRSPSVKVPTYFPLSSTKGIEVYL